MKKSELQNGQSAYHDLIEKAKEAEKDGFYRDSVRFALSACDYTDAMMQYERKYEEKEFKSVQCFDIVLKYSPLFLDFESLDMLLAKLKECKRIEKNTDHSMVDKVERARSRLGEAYWLLTHVEDHAPIIQDELIKQLGGSQKKWIALISDLHDVGILRRVLDGASYILSLSTNMQEEVKAMCFDCGAAARAPKRDFLSQQTCSQCGHTADFVIIPTASL